ncbi:MAG: CIA30 family protein, partial [Oribacterium sp.]|nr:CIA30 family protein [Oribacterium sp.]
GEYYTGSDASLNAAYSITFGEGEISFAKELSGRDYSAFDSIYLWVKPDGSGNELQVRLRDSENRVWASEKIALSGAAQMNKLAIDKSGDFNWGSVSGAEFVIVNNGAVGTDGAIMLDSANVYTGNYGIGLEYSFGGESSRVYIDSVYASSSTKVDDFEGYSGSNTLLNQAYSRNTNGGTFNLSLDSGNKYEGSYGLRVDYDYNGTGYAGATKTMDMLNLSGYDGFTMYLDSDGSGNEIKVQMETDTSTYAYTGYMTGKGPMIMYMPFSKIIQPDWATSGTPQPIDSSQNLKSVSIYTNQSGQVASGTFYADDLKGANFVEDLASGAGISMDEPSEEITEFPYSIGGSASYVEYVTVTVGDKKFNVPVDADGKWSYELTEDLGLYNTDALGLKAGIYYPDGEAVAESAQYSVKLNLEANDAPEEEKYDNIIWSWDFEEKGVEGWTFEGFSPWLESGRLVAWSQDGYEAEFSYTVTDIPNGIYALSNDIKVKSNMNSAVMALISGDNEVRSLPIDTADQIVEDQLLGEKITVENNAVTVKYYVNAPVDANGVTFAVGDVKLYLMKSLESEEPDENGDGDENGESGEPVESGETGESGDAAGETGESGEAGNIGESESAGNLQESGQPSQSGSQSERSGGSEQHGGSTNSGNEQESAPQAAPTHAQPTQAQPTQTQPVQVTDAQASVKTTTNVQASSKTSSSTQDQKQSTQQTTKQSTKSSTAQTTIDDEPVALAAAVDDASTSDEELAEETNMQENVQNSEEKADAVEETNIQEEEVPEASFNNVEPSESSFPIIPVSTLAVLMIIALAVFGIRKRFR